MMSWLLSSLVLFRLSQKNDYDWTPKKKNKKERIEVEEEETLV